MAWRIALNLVLVAALGALLSGCKFKPPPDPNDPKEVGVMQADVLERNLQGFSNAVNMRVAEGEITDEEGRKLLADYAGKLVDSVNIELIAADEAWKYGDVFRTAQRWQKAKAALEVAVKYAVARKNEDRRVNDSLRLAQCQAQLGEFEEALRVARSTFDVRPEDKAPILMAVLYEVLPPFEVRGPKVEAAKLLEEAIGQHRQVLVDPKSESGAKFLAVRSFHQRKAWAKVVELYRKAGKPELAEEARLRGVEDLSGSQRL